MPFFIYAQEKYHYVGKVPKIIFEELTYFEVFLVGKVPKSSVFNRVCLESIDLKKCNLSCLFSFLYNFFTLEISPFFSLLQKNIVLTP